MLLPCAIEADKPVGGQDLEVGRMKVLATTVGRTDEDPLLQTETASFSDVSRLSQLRRCFWRRCVDSVRWKKRERDRDSDKERGRPGKTERERARD